MKEVKINRIIRRMGNGSTNPLFAIASDEEKNFNVVIKTKANSQGILSVVNEWISYNLAKIICLPMPQSGIGIIDKTTLIELPKGDVIVDEEIGSCFYSSFIEKTIFLNPLIMNEISNDCFEKIMLFDHIIYNKDRNKGNIFVTMKKQEKELYCIDHTHVFKNETIWDKHCFEIGMKSEDFRDKNILEANGYDLLIQAKNIKDLDLDLRKEATYIKGILTKNVLDDVFKDIPKDWNVNIEDLMALKDYILYRVDHIYEICDIISEHVKAKRR